MCGIAGVVSPRPLERVPNILETFSRTLRHRGPDDHGFLTWAGEGFSRGRDAVALAGARVALVHRRLAIFDLSERGWQPMVDPSGRHAIVFNGEIYNHPELRRELEADGCAFVSTTDTEVLLHLLMRQGIGALRRTVGMFAFGFLDVVRRRLWLGRDPFGIKPLFIADSAGTVAFASEIRPLLELGFARRVVNPGPLFDFLRSAVTDGLEETPIEGIRPLRAAHTVEVNLDTGSMSAPQAYWRPSSARRVAAPVAEVAEELRALFSRSVALHLRADVPVAATLSGGIDSSAIVSEIRRQQPVTSLPVFSYIADDPALSEARFVDLLARDAAVEPHRIHLNPDELAEDLDAMILSQEQPFTTTSMWAQSRVFRRVRQEGYKVVLDGQGADELFAGYPVFRAARLRALIRGGHWSEASVLLRAIPSGRAVTLLQATGPLLPSALQAVARRMVGRPTMPDWLNGEWFSRHAVQSRHASPGVPPSGGLIEELQDATLSSSLPMLLRYADRNAMAVSLENRVPFLTTALADFAYSLPDELLIAGDGTTKAILRRAMRGIVPDVILDRRDKIGFVTPEARWFAGSPALRARLADAVRRPLPPCFSQELGTRLREVAAGRQPYTAEVWRSWNVLRWAELLQLEFPS